MTNWPPLLRESRIYEIRNMVEWLEDLAKQYRETGMRNSERLTLNAIRELKKLKHIEEITK